MARQLKNEIKYAISLDDNQKEVKDSIWNNQIVIVTGRAGSGKSLVCAQTALDLFFKKEVRQILVTRANVETGRSLGLLPGSIGEKFNPYLEAFKENLFKVYVDNSEKKTKLEKHIENKDIDALPVAFIRGKTIDDILICEETQNLSAHEVMSIVTRLGKNGRIVFNGDFDQIDTRESYTGLHFLVEMAKQIPEIKVHKLKNNHRSDLVAKILDYDYARRKKNQIEENTEG